MDATSRMATNLKEAVLYQSHATSLKAGRALTEILTPQQALKYKEWVGSNKNRIRDHLARRTRAATPTCPDAGDKSSSLLDVCERLEKIVISQERSSGDDE